MIAARRAGVAFAAACAFAASLAASLMGCRDDAARDSTPLAALREVARAGTIADRALAESSGLAPSSWDAGVFWSHNDSGNEARLYALDTTGAALGRFRVSGAFNVDWEALALGPCDAGACLYIADVGDNRARRRSVSLWRVREPGPIVASDSGARAGTAAMAKTDSATRLPFRFPDEPHDVEAMWVAPDTAVWMVTKRPSRGALGGLRPVLLFRIPSSAWRSSTTVVAELVDSLPIVPVPGDSDNWVTDAAFTSQGPDGATVAVRTYQAVMIFDADATTGRPGRVRTRCTLAALRERFGESLAWMPDGRLLFGSEGRGSRLWTARC